MSKIVSPSLCRLKAIRCYVMQLCPRVEWDRIKLDFTGLPISLELHCLIFTSSKDDVDILEI